MSSEDDCHHEMPKTIVVERRRNGHMHLIIDGVRMTWYTRDGYQIEVRKNEAPSVTFTLVAEVVNVDDRYLDSRSQVTRSTESL